MWWYALQIAVFFGVMYFIDFVFLPGNQGGSEVFAVLAAFAITLFLSWCIRLISAIRAAAVVFTHDKHARELPSQDKALSRTDRRVHYALKDTTRTRIGQNLRKLP